MRVESADARLPQSDLELLSQVRLGQEQALVTLFDRYSRVVYAVALKVLHDSAAAEDVMQEIFLKVWRDAPSVQERTGTLLGWFSVLARNRAIDVLRRQRRSDSVEETPLQARVDVAEQAEMHILYDRARSIINALPEEQRTVLQLAFFDGLSHSEISARLSSPLGTVKTRIRQALLAIRKAAGV